MKVLGIDPGTARVGYGLIDYNENKYRMLDYGCIYTSKDIEMPKRLNKIHQELKTLIKLYDPDYIAVEKLFYFKNKKTVISVGQARGVIVLTCEQAKKPITGYTPLQIKMGITGYGRAKKKQVQLMVKKILKLKELPKPDDAADGLAIAITHINTLTNSLSGISTGSFRDIDTKKVKGNKISLEDYKKLMK
ncbi:MAG: crossover junction endodeoxyribonuclease RuvC [Fusobacteriota bacterium]